MKSGRTLLRHLYYEQFFAFFGFAYMRRNEWVLYIWSVVRFKKDATRKEGSDVTKERMARVGINSAGQKELLRMTRREPRLRKASQETPKAHE
jgi:hypothetical protein